MDEAADSVVSDLEKAAGDHAGAIEQQTLAVFECVKDYARREPVNALLVAGAVGLVVGVLLMRR